jgi:hypothetical protein
MPRAHIRQTTVANATSDASQGQGLIVNLLASRARNASGTATQCTRRNDSEGARGTSG